MDFITIDFEIANRKFNSACSIGICFVENNKIVNEMYFLIKPPNLEMDEDFSSIHNLTIEDLKHAQRFDEVWSKISHYFCKETLIVAHNAHFDMNVLKNCIVEYSLDIPEFNYVCSIPISTRACRGEGIGGSLKDRTERFGVIINEHHNALSDARACAELVINCIELKKRKSIHSYCKVHSSIPIKLFSELKTQSTFMKGGKKFNKVKVTDISPSSYSFDNGHPFFEKQIVFTGNLESIERVIAMQKVVDVGGIIKNGVSRKTDYLVVGFQDKALVGNAGTSTKERKAYELIEKNHNIQIINESKFLELLTPTSSLLK
jgi:DNA polymerase-3 subunit epsilon